MRWGVFIAATFLTLALEISVKPLFVFSSYANIAPSFMIVLLVFLALQLPRMTLMWATLLLGMLMDLSQPENTPGGGQVFLIGRHAIGYVVAAYLIVQMRAVVFRQRLITLVVFSGLAMLLVGVTRIVLLGVRGWFGDSLVWAGGSALGELVIVLLVSVYSAIMAVPIGWLLLRTVPMWGFITGHQRMTAWR